MKSLITALVLALGTTAAQADTMKMAVTTSFNNSGLSDVLLPAIKEDLDLDVQLLIVGTGQALRLGEAGDVDAILVHSKKAEEAFVADGYGTHRREIMYNDFVLIGPNDDPAAIKDAEAAKDALVKIEAAEAPFVSRGDDSGTHKKNSRFGPVLIWTPRHSVNGTKLSARAWARASTPLQGWGPISCPTAQAG
ncbi:hypothetical protein Sulfitobl28_01020 [Sulfitobacter pontiacus]|nr:hypothetical protein Sulfitobl28_01020 [Sulfitobacter pontiacus]